MTTTFTYTPEYRTGLTFTWEGGEYINTTTNAVVNVWDTSNNRPKIERTQDAFEAACDEWIRAQDPADGEIGGPVSDLPLSLLLRRDGVTLNATLIAMGTDAEGWQHREFRGVFTFEGRTMEHAWKEGIGNPETPNLLDVIAPAIRQAATAEAADDYEEWASDFASDPEQWMSREDYETNVQMAKNFRALLGDRRFEAYADADHDD